MSPRETVSTGERLIFCSKGDCDYAGDEVTRSLEPVLTDDRRGHPWFRCESDILVCDLRSKFGKTCARYRRSARPRPE